MTLYIYDIGLYFRYTDFTIKQDRNLTLVSSKSLFNPLYINSTAKTCTNLITLKKGQLMMNCLGEGWMHRAVVVTIDLTNLLDPKATFVRTSYDF